MHHTVHVSSAVLEQAKLTLALTFSYSVYLFAQFLHKVFLRLSSVPFRVGDHVLNSGKTSNITVLFIFVYNGHGKTKCLEVLDSKYSPNAHNECLRVRACACVCVRVVYVV